MQNLGCKVVIKYNAGTSPIVLRNVTEIHYNYNHNSDVRIAFESDIHKTGVTQKMSGIEEFETALETEVADNF